jgi:hypothetical protein
MDPSTLIIAAAVLLIVLGYKYLTRHDEIFEKRGVVFDPPTLILGNSKVLSEGTVNSVDRMYSKYKSQRYEVI